MKNFFKVFGIIALAAIIGFSMTACPGEDDDSGGGGGDTVVKEIKFTESGNWTENDSYNRWEFYYQDAGKSFNLSDTLTKNKVYVFNYSFTSDIYIDSISVYFVHKKPDWSEWKALTDFTTMNITGGINKNTRFTGRIPLFINNDANGLSKENIFLLFAINNRNVVTPATLSFYQFSLEQVNKESVGLDKWTVSGDKNRDIKVTDTRRTFAENLSSYQSKNNVFHIKPTYKASTYDHIVMEYDLSDYAGKKIGVEMSLDAWINKEARVAWQMFIDPDYPLVLGYLDYNYFLAANTWHTISGNTIVDVPSSGDKKLYLSGMQIDGAETYFANATLTISEAPNTNTAVTLNSVTADGSASQTTTQLTLTFSQAITGLNAANINLGNSISGLTKGTLNGSGPTYTLPVSGFVQGGNLSVDAVKLGYTITGGPKTVTIYYKSGGGSTPVTPTGVITTGATYNSVTISWNPVSGATGYYVYRNSSASGTYTQIGSTASTSYTDTGLYTGTVYYYKVAAYNSAGTGPQSSIVSAATIDSATFSFTISGTAKTGQKLTAVTNGTGWTGNFKWGYADSAGANTFYYFPSGTSGTNNSEFTIPSGYAGKYIRAFRFHSQGTWTDSQTRNKQFPSNFLGPVDSN
jgi:hypothetical protein